MFDFEKVYRQFVMEAREHDLEGLFKGIEEPTKGPSLSMGALRANLVLCFMGMMVVDETKESIINIFTRIAKLYLQYSASKKSGQRFLEDSERLRDGDKKAELKDRAQSEFAFAQQASTQLEQLQRPLIERIQELVYDSMEHIEDGISSSMGKTIKSFAEMDKMIIVDAEKEAFLEMVYDPEMFAESIGTFINAQQDRGIIHITVSLLTLFKNALQKGRETGATRNMSSFVDHLTGKRPTQALSSFMGSQTGSRLLTKKDPAIANAVKHIKVGRIEGAIESVKLSNRSEEVKTKLIELIKKFQNGELNEGDVVRTLYSI